MQKKSRATQKIVIEPNQAMKDAVFAEIAENFNSPERPSSYFEHRLRELAEQLAKEMAEERSDSSTNNDSPGVWFAKE